MRDLKEIIVQQAQQMSEVMSKIDCIGLHIGVRNIESEVKCPLCYPCLTIDYEDFEHQWNQAKTIEDKFMYIFQIMLKNYMLK